MWNVLITTRMRIKEDGFESKAAAVAVHTVVVEFRTKPDAMDAIFVVNSSSGDGYRQTALALFK